MLIPMVLGALGKPLQLAYKTGRLAFRLKGARLAINVVDQFAGFALDLNGKTKISLAWLVAKLVHGKISVTHRANKLARWVDANRSGNADKIGILKGSAVDKTLEADLDKWLARSNTAPASTMPASTSTPTTTLSSSSISSSSGSSTVVHTAASGAVAPAPASAPVTKVVASASQSKAAAAAMAAAVPPSDPLSLAGLVFLRDCLARLQAGDGEVHKRFVSPQEGRLDVQATLAALYSTGAVYHLADAVKSGASGAHLQNHLDEVYVDLQMALQRDIMDLVVF